MHSYKAKKSPQSIDCEISDQLCPEVKNETRKSFQHTNLNARSTKSHIDLNVNKGKIGQKKEI